uniref:Serine/threonine-protein kinase AFC2 n=1 Tax=Aegilops tauschii TaxID=37682 RepID=M8C9X1_AEGTA
MECLAEMPHAPLDRRPRKRQRLGWDVGPEIPQLKKLCGEEVANVISAMTMGLSSGDRINAKMGEGTFGQVLECWDRERKEMVAIKIIRGIKKYRDAAMIEIGMLEQLCKYEKSRSSCVQIRNWFDYRNHICIVCEKLGPSLYEFLRKNSYRSFPVAIVREVAKQLLECLAFMHDLRLIHTDLKPENILLVSPEYIKVPDYKVSSRSPKEGSYYKRVPKSSSIKVIDFGSTTYDQQDQTYVVSTRHYRAPEVILGIFLVQCKGSSPQPDFGVLNSARYVIGAYFDLLSSHKDGVFELPEVLQGEALFQTHENLEHLAMMERVLGPLPYHMLKKADRHGEKYVRKGRLNWSEGCASRESMKAVMKLPRLQVVDDSSAPVAPPNVLYKSNGFSYVLIDKAK